MPQNDDIWQDWKPVVWRKPPPKNADEARKRGFKIDTIKRANIKINKNNSHFKKLKKIDEEDECFVIKKT